MDRKHVSASLLSKIGLLLAVLVPPVGLFISIIAFRNSQQQTQRSSRIAAVGLVVSTTITVLLVLEIICVSLLQSIFHNQAKSDFRPIAAQIENLGGIIICDNGDGGIGLDNTIPWYHAYYRMPDSSDLTKKLRSIAADNGYSLSFGHQGVDRDGSSLNVTINRQTSVELHCAEDWGKIESTGNDVIIDITLTLPDRS